MQTYEINPHFAYKLPLTILLIDILIKLLKPLQIFLVIRVPVGYDTYDPVDLITESRREISIRYIEVLAFGEVVLDLASKETVDEMVVVLSVPPEGIPDLNRRRTVQRSLGNRLRSTSLLASNLLDLKVLAIQPRGPSIDQA